MLNVGSLIIDSLDYIMIVDTNYKIIYNTRYDRHINDMSSEYAASDIINKSFFSIYPSVKKEESNIVQCMESGNVIVNKQQSYVDYMGREYMTNNVTLPLRNKGKVVAVVELAMDVSGEEEVLSVSNKKFDAFIQKIKKEAGLITFSSILTANREMLDSIEKAKLLADLPNPTLIYGETGTGKELFAQAMITYSQVPKNKVVIQNCAAVPENLMESILFGTVRGVFTGAENKKGLFEAADGGILFLDELNSIPYHVQSKLLRVLQDGTFRPLGSNTDKHVNVKVIGAMNIDPAEALKKKILRSDLFYRFSSGLIPLLPLRERREDIELYLRYYVEHFSQAYNKKVTGISPDVRDFFMNYDWSGNVRELENTVEFMVASLKEGGMLTCEQLPKYIQAIFTQGQHEEAQMLSEAEFSDEIMEGETIAYKKIMDDVEKKLIVKALEKAGGNKSKASEILGIPRQTLRYRMEKLDLSC